ncbi:MFS transporter, partial [Rhodospirillales bacterium]|nr:MFS transporter [Rhodospirillales bacterium]
MTLNFFVQHKRFLAFGFLAAVFSSFGQTFFIALSGGEIRAAFHLSHGDFGLLYAIGTTSSAVLLIWLGRKIDDVDLRVFTACVIVGLGAACIGMAHVIGPITLVLAIFALRLTGQGLMSHIAFVSMGRYFDAHRGKAVSVASMGFPAGEAVFPIIVVAIITTIGWQDMWLALGAIILCGLFPLLMWLLRGHHHRHAALVEENQTTL